MMEGLYNESGHQIYRTTIIQQMRVNTVYIKHPVKWRKKCSVHCPLTCKVRTWSLFQNFEREHYQILVLLSSQTFHNHFLQYLNSLNSIYHQLLCENSYMLPRALRARCSQRWFFAHNEQFCSFENRQMSTNMFLLLSVLPAFI